MSPRRIVILATLFSTCYCNHLKLDSSRVAGLSVVLPFKYLVQRVCFPYLFHTNKNLYLAKHLR